MITKLNISRLITLTALLLFINIASRAQQSGFSFKEVVDSIPWKKVSAITQDKKGFMWFMDQESRCLVRYDGYQMERHYNVPDDSTSLEMGGYEVAYADPDGTIWVGVNDGLDQFDPASGIFKHFKIKAKGEKGFLLHVHSLLKDREGILWIGAESGLYRFDVKSGDVTHFKHDSLQAASLSNDFVWRLYEDHSGTIWVGTGFPFSNNNVGGLNRFDKKSGTFTRYMNDPQNAGSIGGNQVSAIFEDSKGVLWIGTRGDLQSLDRTSGIFTRYTYDSTHADKISRGPTNNRLYPDFVSFITEDETGVLWIGTNYSGICYYDRAARKFGRLELIKENPKAGTFTSFVSHDGVLWVAAQWEPRLFRLNPFGKPMAFTPYPQGPYNTGTLYEDQNGDIWAGLFGKGTFYKFDHKGVEAPKQISLPPSLAKLPIGNAVTNILPDENGQLLLGTGDGLMFYDPLKNTFVRFAHDSANPSIFKNFISKIYVDRQKNYWILTAEGITKWDRKNGHLTHFMNDPKDSTSLHSNQTVNALEDRSGNLWIGLFNYAGLNKLLPNKSVFKYYLKNYSPADLFIDATGVFWVTSQMGLFRYDERADNFISVKFPTSEISNTELRKIVEDDHHNLWIASSSAIFKIDSARDKVITYDKSFGIRPQSVSGNILISKSGQFLIGGDGGFYSFFPRDIEGNPYPPHLVLDNLSVDNKIVIPGKSGILSRPIDDLETIHLAYDQNNFTIHFVGLHFSEPSGNTLYYRLDDYDNDWHKADKLNNAPFFKIPRGNYVLRVKAISSSGTATERTLNIIVDPPWWLSWWAYVLYFIGFVVTVYSIYKEERRKIIQRERMNTKERELAQAKEIEKAYHTLKETQAQLVQSEKMASLGELTAGIAHEIQNPLNFVNNFSELNKELIYDMNLEINKGNLEEVRKIAKDIAANEEKITEHGRRADSIVKGMLQHSRVSTGTKELIDINALCDEYLRLCYHGLRAKDKTFNAAIETHFDTANPKIEVVPQDIGRVLLNICNNAFYAVNERRIIAGNGYVPTVKLTTHILSQSKIEVKIEDNGIGIPQKVMDKIFQPFFTTKPTGQGTGLGLSMSYDIIKTHGGNIDVSTKEGEGSVFRVMLPLK